jgi:hypothetical protein
MPHQIVDRQRLLQLDLTLQVSVPRRDFRPLLSAAENLIFRIQDFYCELSGSGMQGIERNGDSQPTLRVSSNRRRRMRRRLKWLQGDSPDYG